MHRLLRLAALPMLLLASPAYAAEGGLLSPSGGLMIWTILIFLIVLAVLWKLAFPHILGAVEAREAHIRELLESAARDRAEAQALLAEQQRQMEEVRTRTQELMAESRAAGERLKEDIVSQARREHQDILDRAQREIRQETERALETVRQDAVDLAIAAASRLVEKNLDREDNRRLVREYLAQLDGVRAPAATAGV